jgi:hypothetical protein
MTAVPQRILPVKVGWMARMGRPDGTAAIDGCLFGADSEGGEALGG